MRVAIVGSNGLVNRLPEVLAHPDIRVHAFAEAGSPLLASSYVSESTRLQLPRTAAETALVTVLADRLLAHEFDLVIYADDVQAALIAQSGLEMTEKLRILPVTLETGIPVICSKAGLALTMDAAEVPGPVSRVASGPEELAAILATFPFPLLLKADLGGGGNSVRVFDDASALASFECPPTWFPVVVQEFIEGDLIGVDAFFWRGQLRGWLYAHSTMSDGDFGIATARTYKAPPRFDCEEALQKLGAATGMHGFFNCSLMWSEADSRHYLFEADARPTAWHQFGLKLGMDWVPLLLGEGTNYSEQPSRPEIDEVVVHLYPRELRLGISGANGSMLWPWIRRKSGTWEMRNGKDPAINRSEAMELFFWFDVFVKKIMGRNRMAAKARRLIRFAFGFR